MLNLEMPTKCLRSDAKPLLYNRRSLRTGLLCACLAWLILLTTLTLVPRDLIKFVLRNPQWAAHAHAIAFLMLTLLGSYYLRTFRKMGPWRLTTDTVAFLGFAGGVSLATLTEILQVFAIGRRPDVADFYADLIGIACGLLLFCVQRGIKLWRHPQPQNRVSATSVSA